MSLRGIIQPMMFDLVKASIASLLVSERDNQLALLATAGKTQDELDNNYDFNVFKDLYRFPDAEDLPMVNIYNANGDFVSGKGKNYTDSKWHTYSLAIDCYSISTAEEALGGGAVRADKLAAARLDYLWAQVFQTLSAEENFYKGLQDVVRSATITNWTQKMVKFGGDEETAESILAVQAVLELQFEETTEIVTGETLEELVASLEIDDQYISPFYTALIQ